MESLLLFGRLGGKGAAAAAASSGEDDSSSSPGGARDWCITIGECNAMVFVTGGTGTLVLTY